MITALLFGAEATHQSLGASPLEMSNGVVLSVSLVSGVVHGIAVSRPDGTLLLEVSQTSAESGGSRMVRPCSRSRDWDGGCTPKTLFLVASRQTHPSQSVVVCKMSACAPRFHLRTGSYVTLWDHCCGFIDRPVGILIHCILWLPDHLLAASCCSSSCRIPWLC